jgi:pimeloyl-ACP methyl ester carboxylesterase
MQTKLFSNLAGDLAGAPDRRPPLVLLHGLTFDRTMWHPALAHLAALDPGRQILSLDLPGHGDSPGWPGKMADCLAVLRAAGMPYRVVAGSEPEPAYLSWLKDELPQAEVTAWPGSGHFPHLARPAEFAGLLAATGGW